MARFLPVASTTPPATQGMAHGRIRYRRQTSHPHLPPRLRPLRPPPRRRRGDRRESTQSNPTVEAHRTDSLIRVRVGDEEALVHHEFQTTDSNPPMPRRMAGYIGRGIEQHGLPIYSSVIYLRPNAGRTDPGHYLQERHGYRVLVQYQVIRLSELGRSTHPRPRPCRLAPVLRR